MNVRSPERQSVILLGASNLTLGWSPLLNALRATVQGPLDVRVSLGLGRSYVDWSGFMLRRLPGILNCGLWDSLASDQRSGDFYPGAADAGHMVSSVDVPQSAVDVSQSIVNPETELVEVETGGSGKSLGVSSRPPLVLVTDLGNDIVYMRSPEKILDAAARCVRRILQWRPDARIVITGLPLASLDSVGPVRFVIVRSLLFPGCFMSLREICDKSHALDALVRAFAADHNFPFVEPQAEWYRADPIHVIPPMREQVFRQFFAQWKSPPPLAHERTRLPVVRLPTSALRKVAGFQRQVAQPVFDSPELTVSAW